MNTASSAHSQVGEKSIGGQVHAVLSRQEQSAMGNENGRLAQVLQEGNARYEARFSRVSLIHVEGRDGEATLQALTRRLQHTADEEMTEVLTQLRETMILRLGRVIGE